MRWLKLRPEPSEYASSQEQYINLDMVSYVSREVHPPRNGKDGYTLRWIVYAGHISEYKHKVTEEDYNRIKTAIGME